MIEIKYRAWYEDEQKIYEVKGLSFSDGELYAVMLWSDEGTIDGKWHEYTVYSRDVKLMQYTGLKDSKGTEIFEGDIVRAGQAKEGSLGTPFIGRVYWRESEFQWWITDDTNNPVIGIDYDLTLLNNYQVFEVVSNIYEHHELLEG